MRGTAHSRDEHSFVITRAGVEVYAPSLTLRRQRDARQNTELVPRVFPGVSKLDALFGEGIPSGSSIIVAGVAGSGKTILSLEFLYRGAREHEEKGLYFSFEETEQRLLATAQGLGWDLQREIERGMLRIVFIPQPDILVDRDLLEIQRQVQTFGARRVVVDSMSVFLHKIGDARIVRDKVFWLANIVQNQEAVGFFVNDIPSGSQQLTRFGVEETVMDGTIHLKLVEEGMDRHRYIEVVKLRNTAHAKGWHSMSIGRGGMSIYPRIDKVPDLGALPPPTALRKRVSSGVPQLDPLLDGGLFEGSVTLVSGSPGTGKSTLGVQFALEAARRKERALYITLEEGPAQLIQSAESLGLPLREAVESGAVEILYLPREHLHAARFLSVVESRVHDNRPARVVLDSASDIEALTLVSQELRQLLYGLVVRLRSMAVTSLFTLESRSLFVTDIISERGLSPLSDNIFMLRYAPQEGSLVPMLTVVKTRGSTHDRSSHRVHLGPGGLSLDGKPGGAPPPSKASPRKKRVLGLLKRGRGKKK
jgi:circadian clock protein KaiC